MGQLADPTLKMIFFIVEIILIIRRYLLEIYRNCFMIPELNIATSVHLSYLNLFQSIT